LILYRNLLSLLKTALFISIFFSEDQETQTTSIMTDELAVQTDAESDVQLSDEGIQTDIINSSDENTQTSGIETNDVDTNTPPSASLEVCFWEEI
jgi:hypothetical protein